MSRRPRSRYRVPTALWLAVAGSIVSAFVLGVALGRRWPGEVPPRPPSVADRPATLPLETDADRRPPVDDQLPSRSVPPGGADRPVAESAAPVVDAIPLAVVIDDLGRSVAEIEQLLSLEVPLTFSVLPYESRTKSVAAELVRRHAEVLLHLPMQPEGGQNPGPGALRLDMGPRQLTAATERALAQVPGAVGVNNHMGSGFTAHRAAMEIVVGLVGRSGRFYLDSRTSADSLGYAVARSSGVPTAARDVFLDQDRQPEAVRAQFHRLLDVARRQGSAIAIGHPHRVTIEVLREEVPRALARGFRFVPVSALMERGHELG